MLRDTNLTHGQGVGSEPPRNTKLQEGLDGLEVQDRELATLTELDPDSLDKAFSYRWVYKNPKKTARMRARGYKFVDPTQEEPKNLVGDVVEVASDGTYTVGDTVLMKVPRVVKKARDRKKARKTESRLKGPQRSFKKKAREQSAIRGQNIEVITKKDPQREEED